MQRDNGSSNALTRETIATLARVLCGAVAFATWAPAHARAFSDPATFSASVADGGGGGRFFTGSPADGYTCKVCHSGAPGPDVEVLGLPLAGYAPGTSYEVTIDWPDQLENVALSLELSDVQGHAAGSLRLPPKKELFEPERCVPVGAGVAAGMLIDAPSRTILTVPNCGARRVRFLWTAPAKDIGAIWFNGSLVRGDGKSDVNGDGVTNLAAVVGSPAVRGDDAVSVRGSCSALPRAPARAGLWWVGLIATCWLGRVARRRRV